MPIPQDNTTHRVSVQKRNLITLPKEIREALKINEGDVLEVHLEGDKIVMVPYKLIPSSQAYFWTETTQKNMLEAREDVESGRVRVFSDIDEFLKGLDND